MKKTFKLLCGAALLLTFAGICQPTAAHAVENNTIVHITNKNDFQNFSTSPNAYDGKTILLDADLQFDGSTNNVEPISSFHGTFDGQGHTISGIKQVRDGVGTLFKNASGEIKNLTVKDCEFQVNSSNGEVAAIAVLDSTSQPLMINNCHVTNTSISAKSKAAGIGIGTKISSIKNCTVINDANNKIISSGVAAGISVFCKNVENSMNTSNVESTEAGDNAATGIVYHGAYVKNCYNAGQVLAAEKEAVKNSALIANIDSSVTGSIEHCYYIPDTELAAISTTSKNVLIDTKNVTAEQLKSTDFVGTLNENIGNHIDWFSWEIRSAESAYPQIKKLMNISSCTSSLAEGNYEYTGSQISPKAIVTDGTKLLTEGLDYYTIYENNISAGTATATIYGRNLYTGNISLSFSIAKAIPEITAKYTLGTVTGSRGSKIVLAGNVIKGDENTVLTYNSSSTKLCTVDETGLVKALKPGIVKISITYPETENYTTLSKSFTYTINPTKATPSVSSKKPKQVKVKWKKSIGCSGYEIEVSANKGFTGIAKKITIKGASTTKKTIKGLKKGMKYFVRVRAYKKASLGKTKSVLYSAWVKKAVKVK